LPGDTKLKINVNSARPKKKQHEEGSLVPDNGILSEDWYRTIELTGSIDELSCSQFLNAIQRLLNENPCETITILISSNGGSVEEAFAMYDILRHARQTCVVRTVCYGRAYSAGSLILACGSKGHRYAYPSATAMIHGLQLDGFVMGHIKTATLPMMQNALEAHETFEEYLAYELLKEEVDGEEVCLKTKQLEDMTVELGRMMDRDTYLNATQMKKMGLIDEIGIPALERVLSLEEATMFVNAVMNESSVEDDGILKDPEYVSQDGWRLIPIGPEDDDE